MRPASFLMFPRRVILTAILCAALIVIVGVALRGCQSRPVAPPTCTSLQPWVFYGGDWTSDGNMLESTRNGRGDMAISRRQGYRDFDFTVQMQMHDLYPGTNYGDAGVLFRVANPHIGVDSYSGYYMGLRVSDHALFFGRVDGEWKQLAYTPLPGPVAAGNWYRLSVQARGCRFQLNAAPVAGGAPAKLEYTDPHCLASGSIGVRVYYAKAWWRALSITAH